MPAAKSCAQRGHRDRVHHQPRKARLYRFEQKQFLVRFSSAAPACAVRFFFFRLPAVSVCFRSSFGQRISDQCSLVPCVRYSPGQPAGKTLSPSVSITCDVGCSGRHSLPGADQPQRVVAVNPFTSSRRNRGESWLAIKSKKKTVPETRSNKRSPVPRLLRSHLFEHIRPSADSLPATRPQIPRKFSHLLLRS